MEAGMEKSISMQNLEFIGRSLIGIAGTIASFLAVMLETIGVLASLAAGLATAYYMITKAHELKRQGDRDTEKHNIEIDQMNNENN